MTKPVRVATTDAEILACYPVMRELRPHVQASDFVRRIRLQQQEGYRLVFVTDEERPVCVAGFRIGNNLAWGHFMYVDDLVTLAECRSQGHGATLLGWLHEHARDQGCNELHLDSGMQRMDAHRFYARERMDRAGYHFRTILRSRELR